MWELFNEGRIPYRSWSNQEAVEKVIEGYRLPKPDVVPDDIYQILMMNCWDKDPNKRPTFSQLLKDVVALMHTYDPSLQAVDTKRVDAETTTSTEYMTTVAETLYHQSSV